MIGTEHTEADDARDPIGRAVASLVPGGRVLDVCRLGADRATDDDDDTHKSVGYGEPCRVRLATPQGERSFVFHLQRSDGFGHDRRADRAHAQLEAFDTFGRIPSHVRALDVGAVGRDGRLISLAESGEFYLVTEWVEGTPYADDLRRIAGAARLAVLDLARADALCDYLVALHARRAGTPDGYRRAVRDLVGHGEGIFGMIDGYAPETPGAPPERLREIERRCLEWRWRLRAREDRVTRTHGDFHPFNVVFGDGESFHLLDASRGCVGDPADDVAAMTINFVFFALDHADAWKNAMRPLFHRFFARYLERSGDDALLDVVAPFFAWRGLVVASPAFYPSLPAAARDRLLGFVERTLDAPRFDPALADQVFA
jgi:hypothetical protein